MTLDIKVLLKNLLKKQMSIQHFTAKTEVFSSRAIPSRIKRKIKAEFGDQFLLDANYVVFFRGNIGKEELKKLFNLTNNALGEDANRLVEGDFKRISFTSSSSDAEDDSEVAGPEDNEDAEDTSAEEPEEDAAPQEEEDDFDETPIDDEVEKIVNKGKLKKLNEDTQIDPSVDAYVFLKITTK